MLFLVLIIGFHLQCSPYNGHLFFGAIVHCRQTRHGFIGMLVREFRLIPQFISAFAKKIKIVTAMARGQRQLERSGAVTETESVDTANMESCFSY
jgi:hypothetical protein